MKDGDLNNALQCSLQVLLEIEDIAIDFSKATCENPNEFFILMKKLYVKSYWPKDERKPIKLNKYM